MALTKFTEKLISDSFKTTISGSDTAESSSFASRVTLVEAGDTSKTLVSSSVLSSPSQGTIRLATNGVNTDVDSGLQVGASPTFAAGTITGDLSVGGTLTAQEVHTEFESASVIFTSGSTIFGDTIDDTHKMTGSLFVSGNIHLPDDAKINLGSSDDGNIKHSGTNLQIQETTGNIQLINYANDKDIVLTTDDGSGGTTAYITLDGSTTKVEVAKDTNFAGNVSGSITSTGSFGDIRLGNPTGPANILSDDSLVLGAKSVVSVNIDYDGNQTDRAFIVRNNTDLATGGTELFRVNEDGNSIFAGDVSSSLAGTGSFGQLLVRNTVGQAVNINNAADDVALYSITAGNNVAKFESSDGTAAIVIEDNSSTGNANRVQVVGDLMELVVANSKRVELGSGNIVFNQDSDDVNFRIESNNDQHMLSIDGGKDKIAIGSDIFGDDKMLVA